MPLIHTFPGPRTAIAWHLATCFSWLIGAGTIGAVYLGYLNGTGGDTEYMNTFLPALCLTMFSGGLRSEQGIHAFQWRLPIRTETMVRAEILFTAILACWFFLCYSLALLQITSLETLPDGTYLFDWIVASWLGLLMAHICGSVGFQAGAWIVFVIVGVLTRPGFKLVSYVVTSSVTVGWGILFTLAILAILLALYFAVLMYLTRRIRYGAHTCVNADNTNEIAWTWETGPPPENTQHYNPVVSTPFPSRRAAQTWYAGNFFLRSTTRNPNAWSYLILILFFGPELLEQSDAFFADFFCAVALMLLDMRFAWWWKDAIPHLPLDNWSRTRIYSRYVGMGIVAICTATWFARFLLTPGNSSISIVTALAPALLPAALWVCWSGLALAPGVLVYLLFAFAFPYYTEQSIPFFAGPAVCALWLFALTFAQHRITRYQDVRGRTPALAAIAAILVGIVIVAHTAQPTFLHWSIREALGCALLLTLLHHHVLVRSIPRDDARRLGLIMLGLALAAGTSTAIWGPFAEPQQGLMAIFLAFGVVPPLFLPFITIPHYMAWVRSRTDEHKKLRKKMRWISQ